MNFAYSFSLLDRSEPLSSLNTISFIKAQTFWLLHSCNVLGFLFFELKVQEQSSTIKKIKKVVAFLRASHAVQIDKLRAQLKEDMENRSSNQVLQQLRGTGTHQSNNVKYGSSDKCLI